MTHPYPYPPDADQHSVNRMQWFDSLTPAQRAAYVAKTFPPDMPRGKGRVDPYLDEKQKDATQ